MSNVSRTWHPRRLALTRDVVFLLHPNSTKIVDAIPLFELEEVALMQEVSKEGGSKVDVSAADSTDGKPSEMREKKNAKSNTLMFSHSFQLRTSAEGYNSGRQYVIQTHSDPECQALVEQIAQLAKVSTEKYLAKSRFLKAQVGLLRTFASNFQD